MRPVKTPSNDSSGRHVRQRKRKPRSSIDIPHKQKEGVARRVRGRGGDSEHLKGKKRLIHDTGGPCNDFLQNTSSYSTESSGVQSSLTTGGGDACALCVAWGILNWMRPGYGGETSKLLERYKLVHLKHRMPQRKCSTTLPLVFGAVWSPSCIVPTSFVEAASLNCTPFVLPPASSLSPSSDCNPAPANL